MKHFKVLMKTSKFLFGKLNATFKTKKGKHLTYRLPMSHEH